MTKTHLKMKQNQLKMDTDLKTRKSSEKICFHSENIQQNMKKQWKDIKNSYFQKNVFSQLKRKQELLWTRLLKWEASPQSWKNVNKSNKFKSWKMQKKLETDVGKWKENCQKHETIVKKSSKSDNRLWCWKKAMKFLSNYFWNANINELLKKTVKIEEWIFEKNSNEVEVSPNFQ